MVLIFIQQGILFLLVYKRSLLYPATRIFITVMIALVVIEVSHGFYYLTKEVFIKNEVGANRRSELLDIIAMRAVSTLLNQGNKVVVCSENDELANIASLAGGSVLDDFAKLNGTLHASQRVTLLTVFSQQPLPFFKPFFLAHHPKFLFQHNDFYFYVVDIH